MLREVSIRSTLCETNAFVANYFIHYSVKQSGGILNGSFVFNTGGTKSEASQCNKTVNCGSVSKGRRQYP